MTKKQLIKIGELFNNVLVAKMIFTSKMSEGDNVRASYWAYDESINVIALHKMGIPMATYTEAVKYVEFYESMKSDNFKGN